MRLLSAADAFSNTSKLNTQCLHCPRGAFGTGEHHSLAKSGAVTGVLSEALVTKVLQCKDNSPGLLHSLSSCVCEYVRLLPGVRHAQCNASTG